MRYGYDRNFIVYMYKILKRIKKQKKNVSFMHKSIIDNAHTVPHMVPN